MVIAVLVSPGIAAACPRQSVATQGSTDVMPATTSRCFDVDLGAAQGRIFEFGYAFGAGGSSRRGIGSAASAFAGLDLAYLLQFGSDPNQPSYEIEASGGATGQRFTGAFDATGLVTRAALRFAPARVAESVIDSGRSNVATFPFEIAHAGELAARPRISAPPELARALYTRERVEVATRLLRIEGAGQSAANKPPGETKPAKPSSWAFDLLPLHAGFDVALQDATRSETRVGGALMGMVEHTQHAKLDLVGIEYSRVDTAMSGPVWFQTIWLARLDAVDPETGTGYMLAYGAVIEPEPFRELARRIDPEDHTIGIGGAGWYSHRAWGGFGMQYKRELLMPMMGDPCLEDRVSGEAYLTRRATVVARAFGARTTRLVDDDLVHDFTAGIELDASYAYSGFRADVSAELGQTFYTALDDALPTTTGFVASIGLALQYTGRWRHLSAPRDRAARYVDRE